MSTLAGSPGCCTTKQLGPLEKGRAVERPPLTRAHSGIHARRVPRSALGPPRPPCPSPPHPWRRIGFLRCRDPVLLPLIKMLSDTGLVLWVSSLLGVGRARGLCSCRRGRDGQGPGSLFCLLLSPHAQLFQKRAQSRVAFPGGKPKRLESQTIRACQRAPWVSGEGTVASMYVPHFSTLLSPKRVILLEEQTQALRKGGCLVQHHRTQEGVPEAGARPFP